MQILTKSYSILQKRFASYFLYFIHSSSISLSANSLLMFILMNAFVSLYSYVMIHLNIII